MKGAIHNNLLHCRGRALRQLRKLQLLGGTMRLAAEGWREDWHILVAIILSARTRDETTILVGERLFKKYPTIKSLANTSLKVLARLIRPVNFYKNKARHVHECAYLLITKFRGVVPRKMEQLLTLPGVGRKTANVFLSEVGHSAIGVDTHVAYISRTLGWTVHKNPDQIEKDLTTLFPKRYWSDINETCVHFGKKYTSRREKQKVLSQVVLIN